MPFPFDYSAEERDEFLDSDYDGGSSSDGSKTKRKYLCLFQTQWMIWRIISGLMGCFFFAAAFVQHNDPDPYLWVPAYTIPCIISWAVAFGLTVKKYYKRVTSRESSPCATPTSTSTGSTESKDRHRKSRHSVSSKEILEKKVQVENSVLVPKYGSANTKFNWIINIHILYCFALGLWTFAVYMYGIHQSNSGADNVSVFGHMLKMNGSTEEAKELMGLCLIIAWLSLLRHNNYILLGKAGICIGVALTVIPVFAWILVEIFEEDTKC